LGSLTVDAGLEAAAAGALAIISAAKIVATVDAPATTRRFLTAAPFLSDCAATLSKAHRDRAQSCAGAPDDRSNPLQRVTGSRG
jgi:hypothetical protein